MYYVEMCSIFSRLLGFNILLLILNSILPRKHSLYFVDFLTFETHIQPHVLYRSAGTLVSLNVHYVVSRHRFSVDRLGWGGSVSFSSPIALLMFLPRWFISWREVFVFSLWPWEAFLWWPASGARPLVNISGCCTTTGRPHWPCASTPSSSADRPSGSVPSLHSPRICEFCFNCRLMTALWTAYGRVLTSTCSDNLCLFLVAFSPLNHYW